MKSASGKKFTTYNPATEEAITEVAEADKVDVDLAGMKIKTLTNIL